MAYWLLLIAVTIQIINQYTISSRASAWLFTVYFLPAFGLLLYFIFGVKRRKRKMYQQKLTVDQMALEQYQHKYIDETLQLIQQNKTKLNQFQGLGKMIYQVACSRLTIKNKVTLLENGEAKYPNLLSDINNAKHTIHIQYYIFRFDEVGNELIQLLIQKAKAGLAVRFIYDDYGSLGLNQSVLKRMRSYGIEAWPFAEIRLFAFTDRLNYRNHRKIVIIDGKVSYVGGINIGNEYNNQLNDGIKRTFWRDSHLRIEGQAVAYLQNIFLNDWNFCTGQHVDIVDVISADFGPWPDTENKMLQIIASGPDSPQPSILFSILHAINIAKTEILITTPYFIPNPALMMALKMAVLRDVTVKILVPDKSDSKVVNAAAQSFYYELLIVGAEIYKYTKGFVHAKTMVVDSFLSVMGTANFDERSFELNFEVNVTVYDEAFAKQLKTSFHNDIKDSAQLQLDDWEHRSSIKVFTEKIARLVSPIL
jgi:cardiolipin synthase